MDAVVVSGDIFKFKQLIKGMDRFAKLQSKHALFDASAEEGLSLIRAGFRAGEDPYGNRWAPPKLRAGQPLRKSGRLQNSFTANRTGGGFEVGTNVKYAKVHQYGATIVPKNGAYLHFPISKGRGRKRGWVKLKKVVIPRRQMVPEGTFPKRWIERWEHVSNVLLEKILKGAA